MPRTGKRGGQLGAVQAQLERVRGLLGRIEVELRALRRLEESRAGDRREAHSMADATARAERGYLLEAGDACGWNRSRLATRLGVSRSTVYRKLHDHGLDHHANPARGLRGGPRGARAKRQR